jgi:hypothetical protein
MWVVIHICMEAMLGISLYSVLISKYKCYVFLIIAYVFSSTKLEKRAEQVCLEVRGVWWEWEGMERERKGVGARRERWPKQHIHA